MNHLTLFLALATLMSCNQTAEKDISVTPVNVDSLTTTFLAGWNNKDSGAIMKTIADNAIVMNDSSIHSGHVAIARNWISGGVKVLSNIKTSSVIKDSDNKIAYDGENIHTRPDTPPADLFLKKKATTTWYGQNNQMRIGN